MVRPAPAFFPVTLFALAGAVFPALAAPDTMTVTPGRPATLHFAR